MYVHSEVVLCIFGSLVAILLRTSTSLHPYSGQSKKPMFGDYEAQRHWMEITTNLDVAEWYRNSTDNDLMYWGLDYPPLTAYHMYICGIIAGKLDSNYIELYRSRGFESAFHKLFMRYTVLIADVILFIPAIVLYFSYARNNGSVCKVRKNQGVIPKSVVRTEIGPVQSSGCIILSLLYPGLILIDHGHFQYNCISLGFTALAVLFIVNKYDVFASILFSLALNYKQMELYHALPFFLYLLSTCVPKPGHSMSSGINRLLKISLTVVFTFGVIWSPFLFNVDDFLQVLHRLFPVARGVFEDKVANVWCALNIVFKFKTRFSNDRMMRYCLFATLSAILPSSVDLFLRPSLKKFVLALINSSLGFFLFSFQVHEKSILLVALPVILYFPKSPFVSFWFLIISTFSMLPLLIKDDLLGAFLGLTMFYSVAFFIIMQNTIKNSLGQNFLDYNKNLVNTLTDFHCDKLDPIEVMNLFLKHVWKNFQALRILILYLSMLVSFSGCIILIILSLSCEPPSAYPDLFPLLISVYSCAHFLGFFAYFNVVQLRIPQEFDFVKLKPC